jgi:hypothetical protein
VSDLREARKAANKLWAGLMAVKPLLDHPYPDDPRWTPWTRFVEDRLSDLRRQIDAASAHPVEPAADPEWSEEERGFVEIALAAADAGNAGHWPTVAGYLADEVRRLRALTAEVDPEAGFTRPLLDREAAARPMPSQGQIDELLQLHRVGPMFQPPDPGRPGAIQNYRRKLRNALLELLNGAES